MHQLNGPWGGRSNGAANSDPVGAGNGDLLNRAALASCPLLDGLSPADRDRILVGARLKEYSRGDMLYMDDNPVEEVYLLLSGLVKITKLGAPGTVAILGLCVPGEVVGVTDLFCPGRYTATAESVHCCHVLSCRAATFKSVVEGKADLLLRILRAQAEWQQELEERFHEMATDTVGRRVARQLVRLHEKMAHKGAEDVEIQLSHEELAQMTGTNLYAISRLFSEWESSGPVRSRRQAVKVRNTQLLLDITAADSCSIRRTRLQST